MPSTQQLVTHGTTDLKAIDSSFFSVDEQAKILDLQQALLESVALGAEHLAVINRICELEEQLLPNSVASVMLLDEADEFLNVYAAPSVPPAGITRLNGLRPGPGGGSCGNVIYSQQAQFVSNTFCDERWQDLRQLAYDFNLCACWSVPIYANDRKIIGTFALSSFEQRSPTPFHEKILDIGSAIIGIVLQRKQAELATQRNEHRFRRLFQESPLPLAIVNLDGALVTLNNRFVQTFGYTLAEIPTLLEWWTSAYPDPNYRSHVQGVWAALVAKAMALGTDIEAHEYQITCRNGEVLNVIVTGIIDGDEFMATFFDVTERKRNEAELQRYRDHLENLIDDRTLELLAARNEAERLTNVKSDFLANMSHEIRSPLNAVLGICYLLAQRPLDAESRQLLQKMHHAGDSLLAIINDILDFSKIEAGHLEIEVAPFRLSKVLELLANYMSAVAKTKDIELIINPPPVSVDKLIGDGLRLQQVLINLLSNAIKFTEQGEVNISITLQRQLEQQICLRFCVRDTGIGIPPAQQQDVFSAFSQADASISRRFGGSGLGLCISQQLVKLMGGELQLNSEMGIGSEFWFELPFEVDTQVELRPAHLTKLDLLIADDSASCGAALLNMTRSLGWSAEVVDSGDSALQQLLRRCDARQPYDVVLLDWKMPGKDGLATAVQMQETLLKFHAELKKPTIVIMVTAGAREELLLQPGQKYVDAILSKPVTSSTLYDTIAELINQREQFACAALPQDAAKQRLLNIRILLVDDSEINREVAQGILEAEGALVRVAEHGQAAVDWLSAQPDAIDLVLMDLQMPSLDGYAATQRIRQNPRWLSLPIIALTAGAFTSVKLAALEAGMNDFISKPFDVELLITTIQRYTRRLPGLISPQRTETLSFHSKLIEQTGHASASLLTSSGIDIVQAHKQMGNPALYRKLLLKFVESYKNAGDQITEFLRLDDIAAAKALTHKLKGVSATLALVEVETGVCELEGKLKAGKSSISSAETLQNKIDTVCKAITLWAVDTNVTADPVQPQLNSALNHAQLSKLLAEFLSLLDLDDPERAEPLLTQLQGNIPVSEYNLLYAHLADFDFRSAEEITEILIKQLKSPPA